MWLFYALGACLCFGVGAALQKLGMSAISPGITWAALRRGWRRLGRELLGSRSWRGGIALNAGGGVLMILAIASGELSVVQPLVNINLLVTVLLGVLLLRERFSRGEGAGLLAMAVGALMISVSGLQARPPAHLPAAWPGALLLALVLGCLATVPLLHGLARLLRGRLHPELLHASSAGLLLGVGTVMIKVLFLHLAPRLQGGELGPRLLALLLGALLGEPALWALLALNLTGFLFLQLAFSHGRAAVVSPVVAITAVLPPLLAGVLVFRENADPLRLVGISAVVLGLAVLLLQGGGEPGRFEDAPQGG